MDHISKFMLKNKLTKLTSSHNGATLAEFVVILPIFLVGLCIFLWIGLTFQARSSFNAAMSLAVRYATTRGSEALTGSVTIQDVQDYVNGDPMSHDLEELLVTDGENFLHYDSLIGQTFIGYTLRDLPISYIYTLIFFNAAMKQKIGDTVKFPCDPDLADHYGCVQCRFLNPIDYSTNVHDDALGMFPRRVGVQCRYRPSDILLKPINGMFRVMGLGANMGPVFEGVRIIEIP